MKNNEEKLTYMTNLAKMSILFGYQISTCNNQHQLWSDGDLKEEFGTLEEVSAFLLGLKHASQRLLVALMSANSPRDSGSKIANGRPRKGSA